jgi:O-succinylbenzoic acid--CoA ligase
MLARLLDAGLDRAPALRAILLGGGPVPPGLLVRAADRGLPVLPTYGMTETCSQVVTASLEDQPAERGGAGRALPGVSLEIGDDGEILVRGPMVARGALSGDGWLHTGDRGRLDADGRLHVEGRLDDVIVTGGENVMATEVEQALLAHPSVSDAAVVGTPDPEWGEAVTAFVVRGDDAADAALIEHVRRRLGAYKAPRRIVRVTELPRNAAGKVERGELRARAKQPDASG